MKIKEIIWIEEIVDKIFSKHNVEQFEIIEVFENKPKFRYVEKGHRLNEKLYAALGQTYDGRFLIIFFIYKKNNKAMIVSARDMTKAERKKYERK